MRSFQEALILMARSMSAVYFCSQIRSGSVLSIFRIEALVYLCTQENPSVKWWDYVSGSSMQTSDFFFTLNLQVEFWDSKLCSSLCCKWSYQLWEILVLVTICGLLWNPEGRAYSHCILPLFHPGQLGFWICYSSNSCNFCRKISSLLKMEQEGRICSD